MFGPVIETEAHLAFAGARVFIPIIPLECRPLQQRSPLLGPMCWLPVMRILFFFVANSCC